MNADVVNTLLQRLEGPLHRLVLMWDVAPLVSSAAVGVLFGVVVIMVSHLADLFAGVRSGNLFGYGAGLVLASLVVTVMVSMSDDMLTRNPGKAGDTLISAMQPGRMTVAQAKALKGIVDFHDTYGVIPRWLLFRLRWTLRDGVVPYTADTDRTDFVRVDPAVLAKAREMVQECRRRSLEKKGGVAWKVS